MSKRLLSQRDERRLLKDIADVASLPIKISNPKWQVYRVPQWGGTVVRVDILFEHLKAKVLDVGTT